MRLKRDLMHLKREMNATSAQDEFSKWARLRRQHDKAAADYDKAGMFSSSNHCQVPERRAVTEIHSFEFAERQDQV